jgi:hypothetical protein
MLRFTQPIEFNDPFEMQPLLKGLPDKPTLENQFHANFAKNLDPQIDDMLNKTNLTDEKKSKINRQDIRQLIQSEAPQALEMLNTFARVITPLISKQIYEFANENLGVLCLTEKPENLLM